MSEHSFTYSVVAYVRAIPQNIALSKVNVQLKCKDANPCLYYKTYELLSIILSLNLIGILISFSAAADNFGRCIIFPRFNPFHIQFC